MSLDEIKVTFFAECVDQLSELEGGLFSMSEDDADLEVINSIFRAVHSIKGGAGSFGLTDLVQFSHVFESALDVLRKDVSETTSDRLELLMGASDVLGDIVVSSRDGGDTIDWANLADELRQGFGLASQEEEDNEEVEEFVPVPISIADLDFGLPASTGTEFEIKFKPTGEFYQCGHDPRILLRQLTELGESTVTCHNENIPMLADFNPDENYLSWTIKLTTERMESDIANIFDWVESCCELSIEQSSTGADISGAPVDDVFAGIDADPAGVDAFPSDIAEDPFAEISDAAPIEAEAKADPVAAPIVEALAVVEPEVAAQEKPAEAKSDKSEAKAETAKQKGNNTIRVDSSKVDRMINLMGELVISQAMLTEELGNSGGGASSPMGLALAGLQNLTREIQSSVMSIRAQPVKPVFMRMSRVIREICMATGKKTNLVFEGEGTEVDSSVIEGLVDPLTHMIRNAVDHGIESPEVRKELGKPDKGTIHLCASHNSGQIQLEVRDDGAGINRERVREKAIKSGIIDKDSMLTDSEVDDLIFSPGFSTAEAITDVSGRGVGMDVVRQSIQAMGGRVSIVSKPGEGSHFTLTLPLTLAILEGMVINDADQVFVVPVSSVMETLSAGTSNVFKIGSTHVIKLRDNLIPIVDAANELGFAPPRKNFDQGTILIFECGVNSFGAIIVDSIVGQRQVVIKSLEKNFHRVPSIAAATILGNGKIALVLDIEEILRKDNSDLHQHTQQKLSA